MREGILDPETEYASRPLRGHLKSENIQLAILPDFIYSYTDPVL